MWKVWANYRSNSSFAKFDLYKHTNLSSTLACQTGSRTWEVLFFLNLMNDCVVCFVIQNVNEGFEEKFPWKQCQELDKSYNFWAKERIFRQELDGVMKKIFGQCQQEGNGNYWAREAIGCRIRCCGRARVAAHLLPIDRPCPHCHRHWENPSWLRYYLKYHVIITSY